MGIQSTRDKDSLKLEAELGLRGRYQEQEIFPGAQIYCGENVLSACEGCPYPSVCRRYVKMCKVLEEKERRKKQRGIHGK